MADDHAESQWPGAPDLLAKQRVFRRSPNVIYLVTNAVDTWVKDSKATGLLTTTTLKRYHAYVRKAWVHLANFDFPVVAASAERSVGIN